MNAPVFNEETMNEALRRAKMPLKEGKLEFDIAAFKFKENITIKCFDSKGEDTPELKEKSILLASISKAITGTALARMVDNEYGLIS